MFTIEREDGREAPYKPSYINKPSYIYKTSSASFTKVNQFEKRTVKPSLEHSRRSTEFSNQI